MKIFLLIGAIFFFIIGLGGFSTNYSNKQDYKNGRNIKVKIIEKPKDCKSIGYKVDFIKLRYDKKTFSKKIGPWFCKHLNDSHITMRITKSKKIFFLNKNFDKQMVSTALFLILGCVFVYKALKK